MVNWYPLIPAGWEAGPNHHGHYGTGFSIFSCTQQPKNLHLKPIYFTVPKHTRYQSWVFLYISLPTKYTISGSILHYKVGLTLSFLSLISRGVGGIQKGNASIKRYAVVSTRCNKVPCILVLDSSKTYGLERSTFPSQVYNLP